MDDTLESLALELSSNALRHQERSLDELRSRTGSLLAASSVSASFLGGQALDRVGFGFPAALALMAFAASVLASLYVLLPKSDLVFVLRGSRLFEAGYGAAGGIADTQRRPHATTPSGASAAGTWSS